MHDLYQAPIWLPGGHLQTLYPFFFAPLPRLNYRRERWETPDGDFIDLDWVDGPPTAPLVVLFHGLESGSSGHYATSLMAALRDQGLRGVVPHFRGCSGEPNRLPRAYHSGDTVEIGWILHRLKLAQPDAPLFAVGVSLGGNALLKWLAEQGDQTCTVLAAAVAVSAPMDLPAAGANLDRGFNRWIYTAHFLRSLKRKVREKIEQHRLTLEPDMLRSAATLHAFDDLYTAPIHGFRNADDYWRQAASKPLLKQITLPTLVINARNDPFMPSSSLPGKHDVASAVTLEYPETGGHAGFVSGPFPGNLGWLPERILDFFGDSKHQGGIIRQKFG